MQEKEIRNNEENSVKDEVVQECDSQEQASETTSESCDASAEEKSAKPEKGEKKKVKKLEEALAECEKKLEAKEKEYSELNDKYLRMMAEYDNFRKRSAKEKESVYADSFADALKGILPIIDNLERAAEFKEAEKVSKGVEMTLKGASDALEKMGVKAFGEKGEVFDPNKHNAVMHVEDESLGEGVITEVFQKGYAKGDKIIRYAMVIVAN